MEGTKDGTESRTVGVLVGLIDGDVVGKLGFDVVGVLDGSKVGVALGSMVTIIDGFKVGENVSSADGTWVTN